MTRIEKCRFTLARWNRVEALFNRAIVRRLDRSGAQLISLQ